MRTYWPQIPLGEVLRRTKRFEPRNELMEYTFAGTYSFARGIFVRERKLGTTFALPKVQRIREGDFVYCKIMAWEGAFGLVPKEADNCVLSGAFVVYELKSAQIDSRFLDFFFKVPHHWAQIGQQSTGTNVRRQSLHPEQFETATIPLPPLPEQQRIVARIEALAAKIENGRSLQSEVIEDLEQLCRAMIFNEAFASSTMTPMRELVRLKEPNVLVQGEEKYQFAGVYSFGRGVFKGQQKNGMEFAYPRLTRLQTGNFVYPKLMAWEGALGVVPPECNGLMVSTEFPVFEVYESRVWPEVLDVYFRTPSVWPALAGASTGTNVRRRRLNPSDFLNYHMPLPSKAVQEKLHQVKSRVDNMKKVQAKTAAELNALLPSILDKAFNGEL